MKSTSLLPIALIAVAGLLRPASAQVVVSLGSATTFGVLASTTVTNTGATNITGDLGVSPGSTHTGFPPGVITNGTAYIGDATAAQALADATTAFNVLDGETPTQIMTGEDLGSRTLTSGVYSFAAEAGLTGILTLDGLGDSSARFDFQTGSTLQTAAGSQILLINGAQAENVYWQIGSAATFLVSSQVVGNFIAGTSITANNGTMVNGRLFALNGAVTLDTTSITIPSASAVPEPASAAVLVAGMSGLFVGLRRTRRTTSALIAA